MAHRLFEGKEHAVTYQKYRISPSDALIGKVMDFLEKKKGKPFDLAVDVGCGSGQGTVLLAPYFNQVIGTDISPAQLEMAKTYAIAPNVSYRESAAEHMPMADGSVDLVTAFVAAHWFDVPRFLKEVDRLLRPRGCLALISYTMDMELQCGNADRTQRLNEVCKEFYDAVRPYRTPSLGSFTLYKQIYDSIQYPETEWNDCEWTTCQTSLGHYMGFLESFTSYQALKKKDPEEASRLSQEILNKLLAVMGVSSAETKVDMQVKYFYMFACKP
ncbi:hypothetical protein GJAV_G00202480 [Gymnothorax javanicus]|nr:hypothetical protein GJAV_G00202480 [Gymnothorax javanicus]